MVITGGAGGIGLALCARFQRAGARVALLDYDEEALQRAAARLHPDLTLQCDVTDAVGCHAAIDHVIRALGGIDVLVNNAGISHRSRFEDTELDVLHRVMDVNFFGSVHCTRAALPSITQRSGWIVAVSSVAGFAPLIGRTGYAASKHALHGFFDSLRAELAGTGVTVLVACPGYTDTGIRAKALDGLGTPMGADHRARRHQLDPDQVASEIVWAVVRRRRSARIGRLSRASWWVSRVAPAAYELLMRRTQHPTR